MSLNNFSPSLNDGGKPKENDSEKAKYEEISNFVERIETELDSGGFFFPEGKKKRMKTRLRKLFYGLDLSKEDIKILH